MNRRQLIRGLTSAGALAAAWPAASQAPGIDAWCGSAGPEALRLPSRDGWFARVAPAGEPLVLRAGPAPKHAGGPWRNAFACERDGRLLLDPTFVATTGDRWRIDLLNALDEPTVVHWHGLRNDTRNDGARHVVAPGQRYGYEFVVRERAGLYWYHPHPHGMTAAQTYRGLFGAIEVTDDDERALRKALALVPGDTEHTLLLQDRAGDDYSVDAADLHHGRLGDVPTVNGCIEPYLDVATRAYRLRIVNAANARTFRLAFRDDDGRRLAFTLLGTDGGLLAAPARCEECFLSPAERIDVLVEFAGFAVGRTVTMQTVAFDPMHTKLPDAAARGAAADAMHAPPAADAPRVHGRWPEGARHDLMTFRVRTRSDIRARLPATLSRIDAIDVGAARERPLRLGFNKGRWRINDRVFAMDESPIEVARDTTEVWLLRNYFTSMPHAMHLHGFHFQVLERETSPDWLAPLAVDAKHRLATDLGWKDTVLVWPGESVRIAVRFAMPFDGPQRYLFHCHNLEHEDGGMMLGVTVA